MKHTKPSISRINLVLLTSLFIVSFYVASTQLIDVTLSSRYLGALIVSLCGIAINSKQARFFISNNVSRMDALLFAFCVWQVASAIWAINTAEALGASFRAVTMFLCFFLIRVMLVSEERWKTILPQVVSFTSVGYLILLWVNLIALSRGLGLNSQTVYMLQYPSETKNLTSLFLLVSIPFHVYVMLVTSAWKRWLSTVAIIVALGTLFLLSTRGVSIAIVGAGGVLLITQLVWKKYRFKFALPLALGLILVGASHWFASNLFKKQSIESYKVEASAPIEDAKDPSSEQNYRSANERIALWEKTLGLIKQDPILGVGAGNWQIAYPRNGLDGLKRAEYRVTSFKRPHNIILSITSETGIIGLALFALLMLQFFHQIHKSGRDGLILGLAMTTFLIAAMFDFPLERMEHNLLFATVLALSVPRKRTKQIGDKYSQHILFSLFVLGVMGIVVFGFRFNGESKYPEMRVLKKQNRYRECINLSSNLESPFFTVDWINYPFAWYRGMCFTYLGEYDEGEKEFERAIALNPGNFHSLNNMGFCLAQQGKFEEALPFFEESLRINSKFEDARFNLAYSLIALNKPNEAMNVLSINITDTIKFDIYQSEAEKLLPNK